MTTIETGVETRVREGFPKQRLVVLPATVVQRCRSMPVVNQLYVTDIGASPLAPRHYVQRRQGLSQAVMIYCLSGRGMLELGGASHVVQQGHVAIIPSNAPHIYRADQEDPWSLFWIHFDGLQTQAVLDSLSVDVGNPLLFVPDTHQMRVAFEDVYACLGYHYSDAGLLAMSGELFRLLGKIKLHQGYRQAHRQSAERRVVESLSFMQRHVDMPLTIDELAARSGQSVSYYSKLFKELTSQSPMAYFIQLKIRKACELLELQAILKWSPSVSTIATLLLVSGRSGISAVMVNTPSGSDKIKSKACLDAVSVNAVAGTSVACC